MQTQTIALIDDDRNILTSISIALEKEGFKVQTYIDGESALIGLTRSPPDFFTKSSAPNFKPSNSSISSSFDVKKITGKDVFFLNFFKLFSYSFDMTINCSIFDIRIFSIRNIH